MPMSPGGTYRSRVWLWKSSSGAWVGADPEYISPAVIVQPWHTPIPLPAFLRLAAR